MIPSKEPYNCVHHLVFEIINKYIITFILYAKLSPQINVNTNFQFYH